MGYFPASKAMRFVGGRFQLPDAYQVLNCMAR